MAVGLWPAPPQRAAAGGLSTDLEFLRQVWNEVLNRRDSGPVPVTLYEDLDLVLRSARDMVTPEPEAIYVDDPDEYQRLQDFMARFMPRYADKVQFEGASPIFEEYGVEAERTGPLPVRFGSPVGDI